MKLSAFSSSVYGLAADRAEALTEALSLGITSIEVDSWELAGERGDELRGLLERTGMKVFICHHITPLASADDEIFGEAVSDSIKAAERAAEFGAEGFMLVPATDSCVSGEDDKERAALRIIEGMNLIAKRTDELGMVLCMENFSRHLYPFCTGEEMMRIADGVPSLRLVLDSGNICCIGSREQRYDCIGLYDTIKPKLWACHVKDWTVVEEGGLAAGTGLILSGSRQGQGIVPLSELLWRLKLDRFGGSIVIEQEKTKYGTLRENICAAVDFVKSRI